MGTKVKLGFPRGLAVQILTQILNEKKFLAEASELAYERLPTPPSSQNKKWLHEVVAGTLRWKGRLDWILDQLAFEKKPSGRLRKNLLIALYQLLAQEDAPLAQIVSETVEEIKRRDGVPPSRFANACLRKLVNHLDSWKNFSVSPDASSKAAWASLPPWLWHLLVQAYGEPWTSQFAEANL